MTANYKSAIERLSRAESIREVLELEKSFDRVYNAYQLTESELYRLCDYAFAKIAKIELNGGNDEMDATQS